MLTKVEEGVKKAINHLELEFSKLQLGRANPALVE
jgi:ribosome recycling factor